MDKWLMVVIGWGIVGPILAIGVCYVISWRMGNVSWRPGCRLSGSQHCLHLHSLAASHQDGSQARHVRRGEEPLATSHLADAFTAANRWSRTSDEPGIGYATGVRFIIL